MAMREIPNIGFSFQGLARVLLSVESFSVVLCSIPYACFGFR